MPQTRGHVGREAAGRIEPRLAAMNTQQRCVVVCRSVARSLGASFYGSFYETAIGQGEAFSKACGRASGIFFDQKLKH